MIGLNYESAEGLQDMVSDIVSKTLNEIVEQYEDQIIDILMDKGYLIMDPPSKSGDD